MHIKDLWEVATAEMARHSAELDRLSRSPVSKVRLAVARNEMTGEATLDALKHDSCAAVRHAVAVHWLTTPNAIGWLLDDADANVRAAAQAVWDRQFEQFLAECRRFERAAR